MENKTKKRQVKKENPIVAPTPKITILLQKEIITLQNEVIAKNDKILELQEQLYHLQKKNADEENTTVTNKAISAKEKKFLSEIARRDMRQHNLLDEHSEPPKK